MRHQQGHTLDFAYDDDYDGDSDSDTDEALPLMSHLVTVTLGDMPGLIREIFHLGVGSGRLPGRKAQPRHLP